MSKTTTITFTDKHLTVIQAALEAYSRARMGQFGDWLDETFREHLIHWDTRQEIEYFIRDKFAQMAVKDGKPADYYFPLERNASWGILQSEKVGNGQLAYEVYQTLRQYTAVTQNGGSFDHYTSTRDPLNYSGEPLPEIDGFVKYKDFYLPKKEGDEVKYLYEKEKYSEMWAVIKGVEKELGIPRGDKTQVKFTEDQTFLRVHKPQKVEKIN
jgi:hypothetical protein